MAEPHDDERWVEIYRTIGRLESGLDHMALSMTRFWTGLEDLRRRVEKAELEDSETVSRLALQQQSTEHQVIDSRARATGALWVLGTLLIPLLAAIVVLNPIFEHKDQEKPTPNSRAQLPWMLRALPAQVIQALDPPATAGEESHGRP